MVISFQDLGSSVKALEYLSNDLGLFKDSLTVCYLGDNMSKNSSTSSNHNNILAL